MSTAIFNALLIGAHRAFMPPRSRLVFRQIKGVRISVSFFAGHIGQNSTGLAPEKNLIKVFDNPIVILYFNSMNFEFKTLADFLEYFHDEKTCVDAYTKIRFRDGEYCPHCGHKHIHKFADGKRYRCAKCKQDFTIKTKSVFGESKLPLKKWFIAIYLLTNSSKGISSVQLAQHVGVCQKTAWFMEHRIREAIKQGKGQLFGTIEADECYIGGRESNKHFKKRRKGQSGRNVLLKTPIIGLMQRGGRIAGNRRERLHHADSREPDRQSCQNRLTDSYR